MRFRAQAITAQSNAALLIEQALEFKPDCVVITDKRYLEQVQHALKNTDIRVLGGTDALTEVVTLPGIDTVLTALVGFAGLQPTIAAIQAGKNIALANKETLVVAGKLVTSLAREKGISILPVDSEHSAIFQCLEGEEPGSIEKLVLTASGGPFRGKGRDFLEQVTIADALKHPNWVMGAKITIDSASLMNKGLEVIEARWLFDVPSDQIEVVVHPQSIVHSMVQFNDGSIKAQLGLPDMKLPIQYALAYPSRLRNDFKRFSFLDYPSLSFEQPDTKTFRNLALAYLALEKDGNAPCVLNAANEVAVAEFLKGRVGFLQMSSIIEHCLERVAYIARPELEDLLASDSEARIYAAEQVTIFK